MKVLILLVCLVGLQSALGSVACTCDQDKSTTLEEQLTIVVKQLQLQNEETEALKKTAMPRHEVEDNQIAFSVASHGSFGPVTVDTNIPFPVVYTNVGDGWNPGTNAFQVTRAGFYLFTTSIRGNEDGYMYASIVHTTASGSKRVSSMYSYATVPTGDVNSAIIHVAVGDFVSVQMHETYGTIDSFSSFVYSTFSGHFLFP